MLACPGRFGSDVYPRFTQPPPTPPPRSSCHVTYHMIPIAQLNTTPYNNIWHPATKYNIESDLHPRFTQTLPLSLCHVPYQPNQQTISCIKVCNAYHNRTYYNMLCNTIQYPIWFTQPPPLSSCQPYHITGGACSLSGNYRPSRCFCLLFVSSRYIMYIWQSCTLPQTHQLLLSYFWILLIWTNIWPGQGHLPLITILTTWG